MKLNGQISQIFNAPAVRERLITEGVEFAGSSPERFGALLRSETDKWVKVLKGIGLTAGNSG
jgi:tripartite-type tricarboxylate transporter receptor subunit TctC